MKTGFTFDEKVLELLPLESFLTHLTETNFSSIELSPEHAVMPLDQYKNICNQFSNANFHINYHVPYFSQRFNPDNRYFDIGLFRTHKSAVIKKYEAFFNIILALRQYTVTSPDIIIHTGSFDNQNMGKKEAENSSKFFIDWFLNFITTRNLDINLLVETLDEGDGFVFPGSTEVLSIINEFDHPYLNICWDLIHDRKYDRLFKTPDQLFLNRVNHVHIHGYLSHSDKKHLPFSDETDKIKKGLSYLKDNNFQHVINDELLLINSTDYLTDLIKDSQYIQSWIR